MRGEGSELWGCVPPPHSHSSQRFSPELRGSKLQEAEFSRGESLVPDGFES